MPAYTAGGTPLRPGTRFRHARLLDPTWKPGPGENGTRTRRKPYAASPRYGPGESITPSGTAVARTPTSPPTRRPNMSGSSCRDYRPAHIRNLDYGNVRIANLPTVCYHRVTVRYNERRVTTMSERVTVKELEGLVRIINRYAGNDPDAPQWTRADGIIRQTPDLYVLDGAYGGYALHRTCGVNGNGESHGVHDVLRCGYQPKRDLAGRLRAFIDGMEAAGK